MLNHGKRWSQDDLTSMSVMYNEGKSIKYIADKLNRTETAIQSKIDVILPIVISEEILELVKDDLRGLMEKYSLDVRCLYLYIMKIKSILSSDSDNKSEHLSIKSDNISIINDAPIINDDSSIINTSIINDAASIINTSSINLTLPTPDNPIQINSEDFIPIALQIAQATVSIKPVLSSQITKDEHFEFPVEIHKKIELTECQERAIEYFKRKRSMCITGPAGTGKTFVLNYIKKYCIENKINYGMTAMTGVAAALISGQTLHSWTGLGLINKEVGHMINTIKYRKNLLNKWTTVELLIIDEVSMMEIGLFETLNYIFQKIRGNVAFFGGVQMILCGDFAQLAPIRSSNYIFQSKLWIDNISDNTVYLNKIMRQDDPVFIKILSEIRLGKITSETKDILNSRIIKYDSSSPGISSIEPTQLFPHKATVAEINSSKLNELLEIYPRMDFYSKDTVQSKDTKKIGKAKADQVKLLDDRISGTLTFAKNAQVMLKTNLDTANGLVNGSRGVVLGPYINISSNANVEGLSILFDNGKNVNIMPCEFLIETTSDIIKRIQIPLELAWASTTHKAQGSTISKVITDMRDIFCDAQGYVTLSRVKSLEGLFLIGINYDKITCNEKVIEYYSKLEHHEELDDKPNYDSTIPPLVFNEEARPPKFSSCMI